MRSKYLPLLHVLLSLPSFTAAEAREAGVPSHTLAYLVETAYLERLAHGIYRATTYEPRVDVRYEGLAITASTTPGSVICLISALDYYELTEEIPRQHWIAIPHPQRAVIRPHARVVRMRNMDLGRQDLLLGEYKVAIFDRERCIVDAFRYLSIEVAIKALRAYLEDRRHRPDLTKLLDYAKVLRVKLRPYLLSLTT